MSIGQRSYPCPSTANKFAMSLHDLALLSRRQWESQVQGRRPVDVHAVAVIDVVRARREDELGRTRS
jgi:hypothetical protein